jgi:hypothetical protein
LRFLCAKTFHDKGRADFDSESTLNYTRIGFKGARIQEDIMSEAMLLRRRFHRLGRVGMPYRDIELLPRLAFSHSEKPGDHAVARNGGKWVEGYSLHFEWLFLSASLHMSCDYIAHE